MTFARSQKGMSMLGWMVTAAVVAFFASAAFKIFPHYMDNSALEKSITGIETDKVADVRTVPEFYEHVRKSMTINAITGIDLDKLITAGQRISDILGRANGSRVAKARLSA